MSNALNLVVRFSGVGDLGGHLKNLIGLGKTGDQALRGLNRTARDLKGELRGIEAELGKSGGNVTGLIDRQRQLEQAIEGVNRQIERQKRFNAIDGRTARITARGEQLKSSGAQNVMVGAGMAAPFILATKAAMDFSSGMVDIQQKAELTNAETDRMGNTILLLSQRLHQLPEDMRSGVDVLAGLGLDPRKAVQMIGPIGQLGTAFKVDLADGANAAFANLNNLKVPISQTAAALDIMAASGNAGAFEVKDMARWFPTLTAQMQALGQKGTPAVADLAAALQIARRGAGDADQAANNVQNLLTKIQAPATIRAFKKNFGVDLPAALKQAYAQGKTPLEAIAELTKKATGGDLSKLGFAFEDMQAQAALRTLIQNLDDYRQIRDQVGQGGGTVARAFSQREARDASVAWASFKGSLSQLAITLGTTLLPVATTFLGHVNNLAGAVGRWAQANPKAASTLVSIAGGLVAARIGFGALQYALGSILGPIATVWGWYSNLRAIGAIGPIVTGAARAFGVLRTAAIFLGQGLMRAGMMMLANPMILAIVAIGVAIGVVAYLVYRNWDKIKAAFSAGMAMIGAAWTTVKGKFDSGVAMVKGALSGLPGWLTSLGGMMMSGLLAALNPVLLANKLVAIARAGITAFKNFFGIKSPSRLFMAMGGYMTQGLALGLDRGAGSPLRAAGRLASGVAATGALGLGPVAAGAASGGLPDLRPVASPAGLAPLAPKAARSAGGGAPVVFHITVNQQPGENADALVQRIKRELAEEVRRGRLSSYRDDF